MQKGQYHTKKTKAKISASHIGKRPTAEARAKMSASHMGKCVGINNPMYGQYHTKKTKAKMSASHIGKHIGMDHPMYGKHLTEETRTKLSVSLTGINNPMYGKHHTEETKAKISASRTGKYIGINNPMYGKHQTEETKAKISANVSATMKKLWQQDSEYAAKMIAGLQKRPTKPEIELQAILDKHFPQFKYNGDYNLGVTLGGQIPDFVNVNGEKEVLEMFGDYWHSPRVFGGKWQNSELGKIMVYNSLGYRCLVIWEHELVDKEAIIVKVSKWVKKPAEVNK